MSIEPLLRFIELSAVSVRRSFVLFGHFFETKHHGLARTAVNVLLGLSPAHKASVLIHCSSILGRYFNQSVPSNIYLKSLPTS
jgi:hypothetical protein